MQDELRELYQEVILDHGRHPRNFRHPEAASHSAEGYNPLCGDQLRVYLVLDHDGHIDDAAFEGRGCAISIASASMMTELLKGRSCGEATALFDKFHAMCTKEDFDPADSQTRDDDALERLQALSGVRQFPVRVKCATLAWHAMTAALSGDTQATTE